jgi:tetratricopeptide (TPR) repeat protein
MALEASGDTAGTEAACRLALQRDPENALAKLQLGKLLGARGEIRGGLALIDEAVVNRGDLRVPAAEACAAAAAARVEAGRADDAVAAYRHARTLVPGACFYSLALAGALEKNGDGAGAESAYHEALQCDPGLVPAMIRLGALLVSRGGEAGRGFALFDQAVAAQPNTAGLAADACVDAGKRRLAAGDAPGAAAAFRNALVITPGVLGYRVELAGALEAAGEDTAALGEYRAVVAAEPESPHSSARMDALLEKRGEKAARVEEWRGLAAANPDAAIPQLYFGLALEAAGDAAGARAALEKALRINPDLAGAREALVRLETAAGNGKP